MNKFYQLRDGTRVWLDGDVEYSTKRAINAILDGVDVKYLIDQEERTLSGLTEQKIDIDYQRILQGKRFNFNTQVTEDLCRDIVIQSFKEHTRKHQFTDKQLKERIERIKLEWELFKQYNTLYLIYLLKMIVNTFEENQICWGVGRGSSVSVYIFYLIGAHDIDSVKYRLDPKEFFHEE